MPTLLQLSPDGGLRRFDLPVGTTTIGRESSNGIDVADRRVSRRHCLIEVSAERSWIEDLGSRNGTFLLGRRVLGRVELRNDDEFMVGEQRIIFCDSTTFAPIAADAAAQHPRAAAVPGCDHAPRRPERGFRMRLFCYPTDWGFCFGWRIRRT